MLNVRVWSPERWKSGWRSVGYLQSIGVVGEDYLSCSFLVGGCVLFCWLDALCLPDRKQDTSGGSGSGGSAAHGTATSCPSPSSGTPSGTPTGSGPPSGAPLGGTGGGGCAAGSAKKTATSAGDVVTLVTDAKRQQGKLLPLPLPAHSVAFWHQMVTWWDDQGVLWPWDA